MNPESNPARSPEAVASALASAELGGPSVPGRVILAPWGAVESANGAFVIDEEAARLTLEAFESHGADLPIDYEHQTLGGSYSSPNGQAPAAGWIKRIEITPEDGLIAEVEWTPPALRQLAEKQYRYLSPVAMVRKNDRRMVALHSAALTNKPAIVGAVPIVHTDAWGQLQRELALDKASAEEMLLAACDRLRSYRDQMQRRDASERVAGAIRAGKLTEAQTAWAMDMILRDAASFDQWLESAPVIVTTGRIAGPSAHSSSVSGDATIIVQARAEYRQHPELRLLTSEGAFIKLALRQHRHPSAEA